MPVQHPSYDYDLPEIPGKQPGSGAGTGPPYGRSYPSPPGQFEMGGYGAGGYGGGFGAGGASPGMAFAQRRRLYGMGRPGAMQRYGAGRAGGGNALQQSFQQPGGNSDIMRLMGGGTNWTAPGSAGNPNMSFDEVYGMYGGGNPNMIADQRLAPLIIGGAGQGVFDPRGNPAVIEALRRDAEENAGALQNQAINYSRMSGLDPAQQGYASLQSLLNTQGGVADTVNTARRSAAKSSEDYIRGLFEQLFSTNLQGKWQEHMGHSFAPPQAKSNFGINLPGGFGFEFDY